MKVTINIPSALAARVQRAAEMRGVAIPEYVVNLLQSSAPAYDNDAQYLKSKIRELLAKHNLVDACTEAIEALVK